MFPLLRIEPAQNHIALLVCRFYPTICFLALNHGAKFVENVGSVELIPNPTSVVEYVSRPMDLCVVIVLNPCLLIQLQLQSDKLFRKIQIYELYLDDSICFEFDIHLGNFSNAFLTWNRRVYILSVNKI